MRSAPLLGEVSRYPPLSWVGIENMAYLVGEYAKHAVPLFKNTIERAEYDKGASCNYIKFNKKHRQEVGRRT